MAGSRGRAGLRAGIALAVLALPGASRAGTEGIHLSYAIYAHGFRAMLLDAGLVFDGDRYRMTMSDHTVGFVGAFITNRVASDVSGRLTGDVPHPTRFESAGYSRGADRRTVIDYAGDHPEVSVLSPAEPKRDKVPGSETQGTIDSLSAVAELIREISLTDRCDGTLRVFDGARLTEITARTAGNVSLPATDRSPYAGTALRCDFTTQLLAGFLHDENYAQSHEMQHGSAWVAQVVPGGPPVPIRVEFTTPEHGSISIYLQTAGRQGA